MTHTKCLMIAACALVACAAQVIAQHVVSDQFPGQTPSNRVAHPMPVRAPAPVPPASPAVDAVLAWDATTKTETVTNGTPEAHFTFALTNISSGPVVINHVVTSCGCTVAKLPEQPWKLAPGTNGVIHVTMNVLGKMGTQAKSVTVNSDKGAKVLIVRANILPPVTQPQSAAMDHKPAPGGTPHPAMNSAR